VSTLNEVEGLTQDPYKIWVSEVMLQQTQINTVIPYFERWIKRFPTLSAVAKAREEDVLKAWEGLGYYSRARNFRKACIQVLKLYQGIPPADYDPFISLPGVGQYIAAAFLSIAHGLTIPVVDGNVRRVVARILALEKPPQILSGEIETYLKERICNKRPGDFNQAIMELGETICKVSLPLCPKCPLQSECVAYKTKRTDQFPLKKARKIKPHYQVAVGVIWRQQKILISKRRSEGLLGGLWEFPGGKCLTGERPEECLLREIKEELDISVVVKSFIAKVNHAYTHFSITLSAFHCELLSGKPKPISCAELRWIRRQEIASLPFPKANHKLFTHIPRNRPF
jgi:A/G-specific adenine glycosylase